MIATLLSKIGIPVLIAILGGALKTVDNPVANSASDALDRVGELIKNGGISQEQLA